MTFLHKSKEPDVLIISGDHKEKSSLTAFLIAAGYDVLAVSTPEEGMDVLNQKSFDIFIIDQFCLGMGGLKFLNLIQPSYPNALKILITNDPVTDACTKKTLYGVDFILTRPIHPDILEEIIKSKRGEHV
jgi:DNA-binding NtrC family response regulator